MDAESRSSESDGRQSSLVDQGVDVFSADPEIAGDEAWTDPFVDSECPGDGGVLLVV